MIDKISQTKSLVKGIVNLGKDMSCNEGVRGHKISCAFSKRCNTGEKRIWDLAREYESYLVENDIIHAHNTYMDVFPAYEYKRKTKRYVLNSFFFHWLENYWLKEDIK